MEQITDPNPTVSLSQPGAHASAAPPRLELVNPPAKPPSTGNMEGLTQIATELQELSQGGITPRVGLLSLYERHRYVALLSGYCDLLLHLGQAKDDTYIAATLIGISNIRAGNIGASMAILQNLKFHLVPGESMLYVMRGLFLFAVMGALSAYSAAMILHAVSSAGIQHQTLNVLVSFIFGVLGSVVSLLSRIPQFDRISVRSQRYCFYTGATAPVIGSISAAVVACLIQSKLVSFEGVDFSANSAFFVVVGFLAGFSERFSGNLLQLAQVRIAGPADERLSAQKSGATAAEPSAQRDIAAKEA